MAVLALFRPIQDHSCVSILRVPVMTIMFVIGPSRTGKTLLFGGATQDYS